MQKPKWRHIPARAAGSTFLLTLLLLVSFDVFLNCVKPLRYANHTGFTTIRQNHLVSKLPPIMESSEDRDVLLTGSSTMLVPAVRCDDEFHGRRTRFDPWYKRNFLNEYYSADYLEKLLSDAAHRPVSVWNASVSASLMSDQYLIVRKYLSTGRRPKVVIISLAPREFLDNDRKNVEKTATYSLLADFTSLPELVRETKDPWRLADAFLGVGWSYYKARGDYRSFLDSVISKTTGHPINNFQAQIVLNGGKLFDDAPKVVLNPEDVDYGVLDQVKPDYEPKPNTLKDIGSYQRMYLPINQEQFKTQTEYLNKLLTLLNQEKIATVVVDIPLVPENYALLPKEVLAQYRQMLGDQCAAHNVPLIAPGRSDGNQGVNGTAIPALARTYERNDYEDTVHMNASGGKKLFQSIADTISGEPQLRSSLSQQARSVASTNRSL
ncbi:MAG: hypothetical protein U0105_25140 [Candidatus Obscuribacterales bacterium]